MGTSHSLLWYLFISPMAHHSELEQCILMQNVPRCADFYLKPNTTQVMASLLVYPRVPEWYAASLEPRPRKACLVLGQYVSAKGFMRRIIFTVGADIPRNSSAGGHGGHAIWSAP